MCTGRKLLNEAVRNAVQKDPRVQPQASLMVMLKVRAATPPPHGHVEGQGRPAPPHGYVGG